MRCGREITRKARVSTGAGRFCLQRHPVAGDALAGKPKARQPVGHQHTRGPARASIRWSEAEACAQRGIADRIKLPRSDGSWLSCGRFPAAVEPQPTRPRAQALRRQFCSQIAAGWAREERAISTDTRTDGTSPRSWAPGGAEGWSAPDWRTQLPPPRQTGWIPPSEVERSDLYIM